MEQTKNGFPAIPKACIFDVDDTLISNYYPDGIGFHEKARYEALQIIGKRHGTEALLQITLEENHEAIKQAPFHTMEWATWTVLYWKGIVDTPELDPDSELLKEIVREKNILYENMVAADGKEIAGARDFLRYLSREHVPLAIASGARLSEILVDLEIIGVSGLFNDSCIISKEQVTIPKPNPEPFQKALKSLHLTHTKGIWAFEDDPHGIHSAHEAGLNVCAITSRFTEDQLSSFMAPEDIIVQDYYDLMKRFDLPYLGKDRGGLLQ